MTHIDNIGPASTQPVTSDASHRARPLPVETPQADRPADQVELSNRARELADPSIRSELVERVRREIADGGYVTDQRVNDTVQAILRELG